MNEIEMLERENSILKDKLKAANYIKPSSILNKFVNQYRESDLEILSAMDIDLVLYKRFPDKSERLRIIEDKPMHTSVSKMPRIILEKIAEIFRYYNENMKTQYEVCVCNVRHREVNSMIKIEMLYVEEVVTNKLFRLTEEKKIIDWLNFMYDAKKEIEEEITDIELEEEKEEEIIEVELEEDD